MITTALLLTLVFSQAAADIGAVRVRALAGNAAAARELGLAYQSGTGVPKDAIEACKWLRIGRAEGERAALEAQMTADDRAEAANRANMWMHRRDASTPAERGERDAVLRTAMAFHDGIGVKKDDVEAMAWYALAAMASSPKEPEPDGYTATFEPLEKQLGLRMADVLKRGLELCRQAARNGNPYAQSYLAGLYARRFNEFARIPPDDIEAYKWTALALTEKTADQLRVFPNALERVAAAMTDAQAAEAKQRVRDWK